MSQPEEPGPEQNFGDSAPQPQPQPQRGASDGELPPEQSSSDTGAAGQDAEDERQRAFADPATLRRAPRYGRFAITGVILGIVACAAAVLLFAEPTEYFGLFGVFAILAAFVAPVCALVACLLALLVERRGRSARTKRTTS
ncbi:MAG TPA: hypothetical protein VK095_02090 [Beutenbergiaceae bacterium]|nr:hypothetical protein [Beutenbergiaceae bacterium]